MLTFDTSKLEASLDKAKVEINRKLGGMVQKFSYAISISAIRNTPIGDSEAYALKYAQRFAKLGLEPIEGFARGSWRVNMNSPDTMLHEIYGADSGGVAEQIISIHLEEYKLGDSIYISNVGPYIEKLENNHSLQTRDMGIANPTFESILGLYQFQLEDYYARS